MAQRVPSGHLPPGVWVRATGPIWNYLPVEVLPRRMDNFMKERNRVGDGKGLSEGTGEVGNN